MTLADDSDFLAQASRAWLLILKRCAIYCVDISFFTHGFRA